MSGIYGIYRSDGAPVSPDVMARMRAAMAYYGPDGGASRIDGALGLGHLLLKVNPEDAFEIQPLTGRRGIIVSAARLDNRSELLEALDVPATQAPQVSDGHLVSLAFDRWGDQACPHLQGDWAMAAWDHAERKLLLARDALGNATLYYHQGPGFVAFASSLKALLVLPGIKKEPDPLRMAQVLANCPNNPERTAYSGFTRLVWAQALTVGANGDTRTWRHWSPLGRELLRYRRDEEYEEAFLEHYSRSVRATLRTSKPIAATLSGGRDSGSVVTIAARLLADAGRDLTAYTAVPFMAPDGASDRRMGNEWHLAQTTARLAGHNVRHVSIDSADYGVLQSIEYYLRSVDGPNITVAHNHWLEAVTKAARRDGAGVLLTGQMGNLGVSWPGNGSALQAIFRRQLDVAWKLLLNAEPSLWLTLKRQVLKPVISPLQRFLAVRRYPNVPSWKPTSALNARMAATLDLDSRMRAAEHDPSFTASLAGKHESFFLQSRGSIGTGSLSELSAMQAHSVCDPTANVALLEFLLSVPDSQFRRRGQASDLFKRTFRGCLPASVLSGTFRGLQSADIGHRIRRELPAFEECLRVLETVPAACAFLDFPSLRKPLEALKVRVDPQTSADAHILLRGIGVGIFLRNLEDYPTNPLHGLASPGARDRPNYACDHCHGHS